MADLPRTSVARDQWAYIAARHLRDAVHGDTPVTLSPREALTVLALLGEAAEALRDAGKAALVVKPTLDKPYPDAPDETPWSRFMCTPARRAYNLGHAIRKILDRRESPPTTQDGDTDA